MVEIMHKCENTSGFIAKAFCEGGAVMYIIAMIGFLTLFLIIERFLVLKKYKLDKDALNESLFGLILRGDVQQAIAFCDGSPAPITNVMKAGLVQVLNKRPDEEVQVAMDAAMFRETPRLEGWTSFLAVFGNVSVLTGLLGTILGLIRSFGGVGEADAATKAAMLSKGISEALNCTAFGLFVAIIAIIGYAVFQLLIDRSTNEISESSMNLMNIVVSNRDKVKS